MVRRTHRARSGLSKPLASSLHPPRDRPFIAKCPLNNRPDEIRRHCAGVSTHVDLSHAVHGPLVDFASDGFNIEPLELKPSHPENDVLGVVLVIRSIVGHARIARSSALLPCRPLCSLVQYTA
jgi:hypothetical protein